MLIGLSHQIRCSLVEVGVLAFLFMVMSPRLGTVTATGQVPPTHRSDTSVNE